MTRVPDSPKQQRGVTRRTVVAGAGALGAAAVAESAAARVPLRAARKRPRRVDVAIVGAGLSGIAAARELVKAGRSTIVLEAQNKVGGRAYSTPVTPGSPFSIERGGEGLQQFHTQQQMVAFARDVGIEPFKYKPTGSNVFYRNGSRGLYDRNGPFGRIPPDANGVAEGLKASVQMEQMAAELPPDRPWTHPRAEEWDSQTFETWQQNNNVSEGGDFLLDLGSDLFIGCESSDLSLLCTLALVARFGTEPEVPQQTKLGTMIDTTGTVRFPGGVQQVAVRHAERLGMGKRVFLNTPVRRIEHDRKGVTVTSDRLTVSAKRVIVALPHWVSRKIDYRPILPPWRALLLQRFPMGSVIKTHAVYDKPFWREDGLTGEAFSDASPLRFCSDETANHPNAPGVIYGIIAGADARVWIQRSFAERRAAVIDNLVTFFGERARNPINYVDMPWAADPWSGGAYSAYTPPGVLFDYGDAIAEPVGRIHWAGAESALRWTGSLEGAVLAGVAAAKEALGAL